MPTLYASIIRLYALHDGALEHDAGQWANAAFYALIEQVDPPLAGALHDWNGRKPFTISSLNGLPQVKNGPLRLRAGHACWLRVTALDESVFQSFVQSFLRGGARPQIQLGPLAFGVSEVLTTPGSHPWAGFDDALALVENAEDSERLALEFASPTAFNVGSGHYALFPEPPLVFGSLATRWRDLVYPEMEVAWIEEIACRVRVSDYRLQTENLQWKGRRQKGFGGRCTYDLSEIAAGERSLLCGLADFAFYAGVGGKTTQGMGQCRWIKNASQARPDPDEKNT